MKNNYINDYLGHLEMTIVEAMQKIDITGAGILFIVDMDNRLMGTLTDGDIRRWLIKTGNLIKIKNSNILKFSKRLMI